jgi:hypothetical protein
MQIANLINQQKNIDGSLMKEDDVRFVETQWPQYMILPENQRRVFQAFKQGGEVL